MKKIITILAFFIILFNLSIASVIDESADTLNKMKILNGYEDGTLRLENLVTRAEFCALIGNMLDISYDKDIINRFSDVKDGAWYFNAVNKVAELGYINGYKEDGTFRPANNITFAESCAILVNILGYNKELYGNWPDNVINKATEIGVVKNLNNLESSHKMTRGEISVLLVNSMDIRVKNNE